LESLFATLKRTQDEQSRQLLELAGKAASLGSDVLMLQVMGGQLSRALAERNAVGAAVPVLAAVTSGVARGVSAAELTLSALHRVETGQVRFGRQVDQDRWASEQAARVVVRVLAGV